MESHSSNALYVDGLNDFNELSNIGLDNNCVAFECNNKQTVDTSKTISDNKDSNIVSETDNTNIGAIGNSSQSDQSPCVDCFNNANLTPEQEELLLTTFNVSSIEELCTTLLDTNSKFFVEALAFNEVSNEAQAQALADCLVEAGLLQGV